MFFKVVHNFFFYIIFFAYLSGVILKLHWGTSGVCFTVSVICTIRRMSRIPPVLIMHFAARQVYMVSKCFQRFAKHTMGGLESLYY